MSTVNGMSYRICRKVLSNYTYLAEKVIARKPKAKYKYPPRLLPLHSLITKNRKTCLKVAT